MKKYFSNLTFLTGFSIFCALILFFVFGYIFIPYQYDQIDTLNKFAAFSKEHFFGTDYLGRDVFSRIIIGMKISLRIGFSVMLLGFVCGTLLGALSGFFGGIVDSVISKLVDSAMAFPGILLALMLISVFGNGINVTILALFIMSLPRFIRISRSGFIKYKNSTFVKSAVAKGASSARILFVHILPNVISDLLVTCTLSFSLAILSESGLSYLGLGVQAPVPSFGRMLSEGQRFILQHPSQILIPAIFLILLVLSLTLIGDGITEVNQK